MALSMGLSAFLAAGRGAGDSLNGGEKGVII